MFCSHSDSKFIYDSVSKFGSILDFHELICKTSFVCRYSVSIIYGRFWKPLCVLSNIVSSKSMHQVVESAAKPNHRAQRNARVDLVNLGGLQTCIQTRTCGSPFVSAPIINTVDGLFLILPSSRTNLCNIAHNSPTHNDISIL